MAKTPNQKSKITVGYARLPGRVSPGSHASYNKTFSASARESMANVVKRFDALVSKLKNACPDSLETAMMPTLEKARLYCPKDTGELVATGNMISGVNADGTAYCQVSFGGKGKIHYAAIVHERTDLAHEAPTRSKYLQAAVEEDLGKIRRRFSAAIKAQIG